MPREQYGIVAAIGERRHIDFDRVEPEQQILAHGGTQRRRVEPGRGDRPHALQPPCEIAVQGARQAIDVIDQDRPAGSGLELFGDRLGVRRFGLQNDERAVRLGRGLVDHPRDQGFAATARPGDERRRRGRRDACDQVADACDGGAFTEQDGLACGRWSGGVQLRAPQCEAAFDRREQAFVMPWLDHEIGRSAAHRLHRDGDPAMPGDDDHDRVAIGRDEAVEQREPFLASGASAREVQVEQDDVRGAFGEPDPGRRRVRRRHDGHGVAFQQQPRGFGDVGIVVDDQDAG